MKVECEALKGYSIKKLFSKLDRLKRGFIDVSSIREFITGQGNCEPQLYNQLLNGVGGRKIGSSAQPRRQGKRLTGLMRRIVSNSDGKITFNEFAKLMKPVDLRPYLRRIRKFTKEEKKQVEYVKQTSYIAKFKQARVDLRKPLTAFKSSDVMLDKNPERHVGLMHV